MNDPRTTTEVEPTTTSGSAEETVSGAGPRLGIGSTPDAPPHAREAMAAFTAEYFELLAHREAHPNEQWVAYRGGTRVGFGTDHREFLRECIAKFPDGLFEIFFIDPCLQYPDDIVI